MSDELLKGQKGSRLSKWIASSKDAIEDVAGLKEVEKLQNLGGLVSPSRMVKINCDDYVVGQK